ncbi:MAG: PH domain-containing protein, partial [Bacillota bacterium]|nr:PH domain-containing protein [Bacillota bacterium]
EIVHGIFFITRDIIPVIRIQNITVKQGPIYRRYDLHTVEIALASGKFEIVGLSRQTADEIAEALRQKLYTRLEQKEGL